MKVLITGDRNWKNLTSIKNALASLDNIELVIHGGARGADSLADLAARSLGLKVHVEYADWKMYGRGAGPVRNITMLNMCPDIVLAFHSDLEHSKGTKHCVIQANRMKIPVLHYKV